MGDPLTSICAFMLTYDVVSEGWIFGHCAPVFNLVPDVMTYGKAA